MQIQNSKHKKESINILDALSDFKPTDKYMSGTGGCSIAYDIDSKKFCIIDEFKQTHVFEYKQLLQSEIIVDGETYIKQSTTNTIGRTVLGGLIGGGVGAVIGGVTGKKHKKEKVKSVDLKIIVNNPSNPIYKINFSNIEIKKDSLLYRAAFSDAEKWHGIVASLISLADSKDDTKFSISIADEISKFKKLLDDGVITKDEFEKKKLELLNN